MDERFLHIFLVVAIFWAIWSHFSLTAAVKRQRKLKDLLRILKHETRMNTDIYPDELNKELIELTREKFNMRMQRATGQLANSHKMKEVRRDIERLSRELSHPNVAAYLFDARIPADQRRQKLGPLIGGMQEITRNFVASLDLRRAP